MDKLALRNQGVGQRKKFWTLSLANTDMVLRMTLCWLFTAILARTLIPILLFYFNCCANFIWQLANITLGCKHPNLIHFVFYFDGNYESIIKVSAICLYQIISVISVNHTWCREPYMQSELLLIWLYHSRATTWKYFYLEDWKLSFFIDQIICIKLDRK